MKKLKILLILCTCMSLQCFAFTFSKAGTVWAIDCNKGIDVSSFSETSSGELGFFSWFSRGERENVTLTKFIEEGDQITFVYKDIDHNDFITMKASLAGGVWTTLYMKLDNQILIQNGLVLEEGKKMRPKYQCAQTSTAYKMVFPNSTPPESVFNPLTWHKKAPLTLLEAKMIWAFGIELTGSCVEECLDAARKFPREYANFVDEMKNEKARYERAQRECATAGDIDRCIRIKTGKE